MAYTYIIYAVSPQRTTMCYIYRFNFRSVFMWNLGFYVGRDLVPQNRMLRMSEPTKEDRMGRWKNGRQSNFVIHALHEKLIRMSNLKAYDVGYIVHMRNM